VYLSSIGNLHLASSYHHVYRRALTPRLEQILQASNGTKLVHVQQEYASLSQ